MTNDDRNKNLNQGEGNREAAEHYNEAQQAFVRKGGVEEKTEERRSRMSDAERREAQRAEQAGKDRAKEEDPNVARDHDQGTT